MHMSHSLNTETELHAAEMEQVERRLVELACAETQTHDGAVFLYDPTAKALAVDFHMVGGVIVALPGSGLVLHPRRDGRPNGIAFTCFQRGEPYVCNDTSKDPAYARYLLDVAAVLAVPIPWQGRSIGVLSVSSKQRHAFEPRHTQALVRVARDSAKFLRRAQLARATRDAGRPFVIKGLSPAWLEVEKRIEQVAGTDIPVLVQGESGTGKDLVSRAIHFNSKRAGQAYVAVNCAAIPEAMLESVLFGHVKGAFTGAAFHKLGEFQKAHGGTLFLDELGELPLSLQAKVLRAIEQGEVTPLGSNDPPARVDVRLVCATNRDLAAMVRERRFRDDLYFRVGVITVELPPLRTYKDNLEILAGVFLQQSAQRHGRPVTGISREALALLFAYDFPGNMRELKNALEHAVVMAQSDQVTPADLPASIRHARPASSQAHAATSSPAPATQGTLAELREAWLAPHERAYLADLLDACHGQVSAAAARAGVTRATLYRLMQKHGVKVKRTASRD